MELRRSECQDRVQVHYPDSILASAACPNLYAFAPSLLLNLKHIKYIT